MELLHSFPAGHAARICYSRDQLIDMMPASLATRPGHVTVKVPDIELLAVGLRPYYLPRALSHVIIVTVYIPPSANPSSASSHPQRDSAAADQNTFNDGNIKVRCNLCAGDNKVLSSYKNTTSNLKKHLESQHLSGGELTKLVGQYVVEEMLPLNTVDSPSFRAII
ncbi:hypothetical protein N1851_002313 [Merluccius polli]|uniref:BED-type domain-containing protein n=1 Tax=Merluccius polli TaxID=89951 RepID=A0AA47P8W6_MERPO|nr:hypothetical protein N1851_002313 [Merluccius polli]